MVDVAPSGPAIAVLRSWSLRQWSVAAAGAVATALAMGLPTDVIPNPVFDRPVPVTWWSIPALAVASILAGLLLATYVRDSAASPGEEKSRRRFNAPFEKAFFWMNMLMIGML